jgi:hypothetical protein
MEGQLDPSTREFYRRTLEQLAASGVPFLVGGAYAFERYTGIARHTKDLDVFVRPVDVPQVLGVLQSAGYPTEVTFPHWLGKAFCGDEFIDVIFRSGNGLAEVDDGWFAHAVADNVFDLRVLLAPVEEMIWQKALIMERERFDGADVIHLLLARGPDLDWHRLLERFGSNWPVLFSHLVLFAYIYPSERTRIPRSVLEELLGRFRNALSDANGNERLCRGTLLSRAQYLVDIHAWGYGDARLQPHGMMSAEDVERWTAAIDKKP